MEIRTLSNINLDELLNVFNESFSDYFVPLQLTLEQLEVKLKTDKVNWDYSVGTFVDNKLVGFILHGFDMVDNKRVVYNGGTGVVPNQRKQGLTKQMYDFILPILKAANIDILILEVIEKNIQAIKSYEKVGYQLHRKLLCYRGEINAVSNKEISIKPIPEYDWESIKGFWDFAPTWQNSSSVMEELKDRNISNGAFIGNQLVGYIVYNPVSKRLQQFGVHSAFRRKKIASTLFASINEQGINVTIINVDESSIATDGFLKKIGFANILEQLEMKLKLDSIQ